MSQKRILSPFLYLSILAIMTNIACAQKDSFGAKDDPAVPNTTTMTILSEQLYEFLLQADTVEAYTFEKADIKTLKDSSAITTKGFKVLRQIPQLPVSQVRALTRIIAADTTYEAGDEIAKCGWYPDLGFIFKKGDQHSTVLLSSMNNCNVIKIYQGPEKKLVKMCNPGRTDFVLLAKEIFPEIYAEIPSTLNESNLNPATPNPPPTENQGSENNAANPHNNQDHENNY